MKNIIVFISLFTTHVFSEEIKSTCQKMDTFYFYLGKKEHAAEEICFTTIDAETYLTSKSCAQLKCSLLKLRIKNRIGKSDNSGIGSPGFRLCYDLNLLPQVFSYSSGGDDFHESSRCMLGSDFIEVSLLLKIQNGKIKVDEK